MRKPSTPSQHVPIAYRPRSSAPCAVISISMLIRSLAGTTWPRYFQVTGRPGSTGSNRGLRRPTVISRSIRYHWSSWHIASTPSEPGSTGS